MGDRRDGGAAGLNIHKKIGGGRIIMVRGTGTICKAPRLCASVVRLLAGDRSTATGEPGLSAHACAPRWRHNREGLTTETQRCCAASAIRDKNIYNDEGRLYPKTAAKFAGHETVRQSAEEYGRGTAHTDTIEVYFTEIYVSVFKRGVVGAYQHCSKTHLNFYFDEFDFRYNVRTRRR